MSTKRKYTKEFKLDAISLVTEQEYTCSEAARSLGIHSNILIRWIRELADKDNLAFRGNRKLLMRRAESLRAKSMAETARTLSEVDYLLGVNDEARQGALRFSLQDGGPYLTPKDKESIPSLIDLPRLLSATEHYLNDEETAEDLKLLLAPGSSLGGARPKASVRDKDGHLAIAKFAKKDDEFNVVV